MKTSKSRKFAYKWKTGENRGDSVAGCSRGMIPASYLTSRLKLLYLKKKRKEKKELITDPNLFDCF